MVAWVKSLTLNQRVNAVFSLMNLALIILLLFQSYKLGQYTIENREFNLMQIRGILAVGERLVAHDEAMSVAVMERNEQFGQWKAVVDSLIAAER